jgi:hypothetical protein
MISSPKWRPEGSTQRIRFAPHTAAWSPDVRAADDVTEDLRHRKNAPASADQLSGMIDRCFDKSHRRFC